MPNTTAAPGYLGSLPSPGAVLDALRYAHKAQLRMAAGSEPTKHISLTAVGLPSQSTGDQREVCCSNVSFCASGAFLAATFEGYDYYEGCSLQSDGSMLFRREDAPTQFFSGLVIYRASGSFDKHLCFLSNRADSPHISWAPAAPHLRVAWEGLALIMSQTKGRRRLIRAHFLLLVY